MYRILLVLAAALFLVLALAPSLPAQVWTHGVAIAPIACFQLRVSRHASFDARAPPLS